MSIALAILCLCASGCAQFRSTFSYIGIGGSYTDTKGDETMTVSESVQLGIRSPYTK